MQGPANTVSYFIAGYVVIFGSLIFYLVSLFVRTRNLLQDKTILEDLETPEEGQSFSRSEPLDHFEKV